MDEIQYLEITSARRDRNSNPLPAEIDCPLSISGQKLKKQSIDPVCLSAPIKSWIGNKFDLVAASPNNAEVTVKLANYDVTIQDERLGAGTSTIILEIQAAPGRLQTIDDYYTGANIILTNEQTNPTNGRKIIAYKFIGTGKNTQNVVTDRAQINIFSPFSSPIVIGDDLIIRDPSDLSASFRNPVFFVPTALGLSNNFLKHYLVNETLNQSRPISGFDTNNRLVFIDTSGASTVQSSEGPIGEDPVGFVWQLTHAYSIRVERDYMCYTDALTLTPITGAINANTQGLNGDCDRNPPTKRSFNLPLFAANMYRNNPSILEGDFLTASQVKNVDIPPSTTPVTPSPFPRTQIYLQDTGEWYFRCSGYFIGTKIRFIDNNDPILDGQISTIIDYTYNPTALPLDTRFIATVYPGFTTDVLPGQEYILEYPDESKRIVKYVDYRQTLTNPQPGNDRQLNLPIIKNNNFNNTIYRSGYLNGLYINLEPGGILPTNIRLIGQHTVTRDSNGNVIQVLITIDNQSTRFEDGAFIPIIPAAGMNITITSGLVAGGKEEFSYAISRQPFCILPYSYDNLFPFINAQGINADATYELQLINIILPNQVLNSGFGSLIPFYQYVYVEIENPNGNGTNAPNHVMSNNPRAVSMTFRCTIDDVPNPVNSSFIKIDGDGMKQVLRINPSDSMKLKVWLGTGRNPQEKELLEYLPSERFSPLPPNPRIQISACFGFKKVILSDDLSINNPIKIGANN